MKQVDVYCCQCGDWANEVDEDKFDTNYICYDCTEAIYGGME
jgi:hypothetical protein